MRKIFAFPFIVMMLFYACVDGNRQKDVDGSLDEDALRVADPLVFDLEQSIGASSADTFVLNTITDAVHFVPLETNGSSVFPNFNYKLAATADGFFVSGGITNSSGVLQFDSTGKFIGSVVKIGRGPNELPLVLYWNINESLRKICVFGLSEKLVVRRLDKNSTHDISFRNNPSEIVPLDDGSFVVSKASMTKGMAAVPYLAFTDSTGRVTHSLAYFYPRNVYYEPIPDKLHHPVERYDLSASYKGGVLFQDVFNDTLYYIKDRNTIDPYVVLKRGKLSPEIMDVYNDARKAEQIYFRDMTETEKYFLIKYFLHGQLYTDIWDKLSLKLISRVGKEAQPAMIDKFYARYVLPNGEKTIVNILYAKKDQLYCLLEAPIAAKFMDNIDEEDNPVVMIVHLK